MARGFRRKGSGRQARYVAQLAPGQFEPEHRLNARLLYSPDGLNWGQCWAHGENEQSFSCSIRMRTSSDCFGAPGCDGRSASQEIPRRNITDAEICLFCSDTNRDDRIVCVVEEPHNIIGIETTRNFRGRYHVLHGTLSPLRGIGPDSLKLKGLVERVGEGAIEEVIVATNPTVEGEATAVYLARLLKPLGVKVTRIAMGMPVGSDLEYVDEVTMDKALANRHEI